MIYKQLVKALKKAYKTIEGFADEELSIPASFKLSDACLEMIKKRRAAEESFYGCDCYETDPERYRKLADEMQTFPYEGLLEKEEYLDSLGIGKYVVVYYTESPDYKSVRYFPEHDIYVQITGSYSSYDGYYFDSEKFKENLEQVFPKTEQVINYYPKEEL